MRACRLFVAGGFLALAILTTGVAWAKGQVQRVYVSGGALPDTVEISDPDDLATFKADFPAFGGTVSTRIQDPGIDFPVSYDLRVVVEGNRPDLSGVYYPDPAGERGYLLRRYTGSADAPRAGQWRRVTVPFDALMAKYGAVLPLTLPGTGGPSPTIDLALLVVAGLSAIAAGFALKRTRVAGRLLR